MTESLMKWNKDIACIALMAVAGNKCAGLIRYIKPSANFENYSDLLIGARNMAAHRSLKVSG